MIGKQPFDTGDEYDEMLNMGIRLSGEDKRFFMVGRIADLRQRLPRGFEPRRILDFGCGSGDTARFLREIFPGAEVTGVDVSEEALAYARKHSNNCPRVSFTLIQDLSKTRAFDLCYCNGVFHHIQPKDRPETVQMIRRALIGGGYFALFENNPWNPGTRLVMRRIPFDRNAQPLRPVQAKSLLLENGFHCWAPVRFLFYFPRPLAFMRFLESRLARLPLGAQYCILATKQ